MCGRFVGYRKLGDYLSKFQIDLFEADPATNVNVAPTQYIPAIVRQDDQNALRMPIILKPKAFRDWMHQDTQPNDLKEIISSQIHTDFIFHSVSKAVNSVRNNSADLIEAA